MTSTIAKLLLSQLHRFHRITLGLLLIEIIIMHVKGMIQAPAEMKVVYLSCGMIIFVMLRELMYVKWCNLCT